MKSPERSTLPCYKATMKERNETRIFEPNGTVASSSHLSKETLLDCDRYCSRHNFLYSLARSFQQTTITHRSMTKTTAMDRVEVVDDNIAEREEIDHVQHSLDDHLRSATGTTRLFHTNTNVKTKKTPKELQLSKAQNFLVKLHNMLQDATSKGFDHIISWSKHQSDHETNLSGSGPAVSSFSSSFVIHQPQLMPPILSQYFRSSLYKSFCRRLQEHNFTRKNNVVTRKSTITKRRYSSYPLPSLPRTISIGSNTGLVKQDTSTMIPTSVTTTAATTPATARLKQMEQELRTLKADLTKTPQGRTIIAASSTSTIDTVTARTASNTVSVVPVSSLNGIATIDTARTKSDAAAVTAQSNRLNRMEQELQTLKADLTKALQAVEDREELCIAGGNGSMGPDGDFDSTAAGTNMLNEAIANALQDKRQPDAMIVEPNPNVAIISDATSCSNSSSSNINKRKFRGNDEEEEHKEDKDHSFFDEYDNQAAHFGLIVRHSKEAMDDTKDDEQKEQQDEDDNNDNVSVLSLSTIGEGGVLEFQTQLHETESRVTNMFEGQIRALQQEVALRRQREELQELLLQQYRQQEFHFNRLQHHGPPPQPRHHNHVAAALPALIYQKTIWSERCKVLIQYVLSNNGQIPPPDYENIADGFHLGRWVAIQQQFGIRLLSVQHIQELESIPTWTWTNNNATSSNSKDADEEDSQQEIIEEKKNNNENENENENDNNTVNEMAHTNFVARGSYTDALQMIMADSEQTYSIDSFFK